MLKTKVNLPEPRSTGAAENSQSDPTSTLCATSAASLGTHGFFSSLASSTTLTTTSSEIITTEDDLGFGSHVIGNSGGDIIGVAHGPHARTVVKNNVAVNKVIAVHTPSTELASRAFELPLGNTTSWQSAIIVSPPSQSSSTNSTLDSDQSSSIVVVSHSTINGSLIATTGNVTINQQSSETLAERKSRLNKIEKQVREALLQKYSAWRVVEEFFSGKKRVLEREYVNLELVSEMKSKTRNEKNADSEKTNNDVKTEVRDERISSYEDLFGDRRNLGVESLFKSDKDLLKDDKIADSDNQQPNSVKPNTILALGRAGVGKTTVAKYIPQAWAQSKQQQASTHNNNDDDDDNGDTFNTSVVLFPEFEWVFTLFLRELGQQEYQTGKQITLREWVYRTHFFSLDIEEDFKTIWEERIAPALRNGNGLIIIDGYDEIPDQHDCTTEIGALTKIDGQWKTVPKLITSRPHAATTIFRDRDIEVVGFKDEGVKRYVEMSLKDHPMYGAQLLNLLRTQPCLRGNALIPLTLSMMCWIVEEDAKKAKKTEKSTGVTEKVKLPKFETMTGLYKLMLSKLLVRGYERAYDTEKNKDPNFAPLAEGESYQKKQLSDYYGKVLECLYAIAYQGIKESETTLISSECVERAFRACHVKYGRVNLLKKQLYQLGLLRPIFEDAEGEHLANDKPELEFLHRTFQEFCAANFIVNKLESKSAKKRREMQEVVVKQKLNPRYQIVWWFVAGLSKTSDSQQQLVNLIRGDRATLESLQLIPPGCNIRLYQDLFGNYELGLLVRFADEFEGAEDKQWFNEIIKQTQEKLVELSNLHGHLLLPKNYFSAFLSALRMSSKLIRFTRKEDLYEKSVSMGCGIYIENDFTLKFKPQPSMYATQVSEDVAASKNNVKELTKLFEHIDHDDDNVRIRVGEEIANIVVTETSENKDRILSDLLSRFKNRSHRNSHPVIQIVARLGESAATLKFIEVVLELFDDKDWRVRRDAVEIIHHLGRKAVTKKILTGLLRLCGDTNDLVRSWAFYSIRDIGASASTPEVRAGLVELFYHDYDDVRSNAARVVEKFGVSAGTPEILKGLLMLFNDKVYYVRHSAVCAVASLGPDAATPEILQGFLEFFHKDYPDCHSAVVEIVKLGSRAATPEILNGLSELFSHSNSLVRRDAARPIGMLGLSKASLDLQSKIISDLRLLLYDKEWPVVCNAVEAFGRLGIEPPLLTWELDILIENFSRGSCGRIATAISSLGIYVATQEFLSYLFESLGLHTLYGLQQAVTLLSDLIKSHLTYVLKQWVSNYYIDGEFSVNSIKFLSAILCGADVSGSCHVQIVWNNQYMGYFIEGYVDKNVVKIHITDEQAKLLEGFKWENAYDAIDMKSLKLSSEIIKSIHLNYQFQLKRIDEKTIIIECVKIATSRRKANTDLLTLIDLFNSVLRNNKLQNSVTVDAYSDTDENTYVDMVYIACDSGDIANQVAKLLKTASGNYIRESLNHGFFGGSANSAESASVSKHTIQCAMQ